MDKAFWLAIKEQDYQLPSEPGLEALTAELMGYLGALDPEIRDGIAYYTLGTWIGRGHYSAATMVAIAEQMVANLQVGLGDRASDTVYLRSFSGLILAELLRRDGKESYLSADDRARYVKAAFAWASAEGDLRGFDAAHGWAHAGAHAADLLRLIGLHPQVGPSELEGVLGAVGALAGGAHGYPFLYDEDERLVAAVLAVLGRSELPAGAFERFLAAVSRRWDEQSGGEQEVDKNLVLVVARQNCRNLLRSLFFALSEREDERGAQVAAALQRISRWA